jgi:8-oxo-dGTP diphosphatase
MQDLTTFPRPNVAVDLAVLTVLPSPHPRERAGQLAALVQQRSGEPRGPVLPGRFLREGETVGDCIAATLREKVGIPPNEAGQRHLLQVMDGKGRDPRGWTISLAHYLVVPHDVSQDAQGEFVPVTVSGDVVGARLLFDHDEIVREAAMRIRSRYELEPDPDGLLAGPFTLADLRYTHEAVLGERVRRDTFRRRIEPTLVPHLVGGRHETRMDGGRPARLWETPRTAERPMMFDRVRLPREEEG